MLLQPYLASVDTHGETPMVYIDGQFSHAAAKRVALPRAGSMVPGLFAPEDNRPHEPDAASREVADAAMAAIPAAFGRALYGRVDLVRAEDGQSLRARARAGRAFAVPAPGRRGGGGPAGVGHRPGARGRARIGPDLRSPTGGAVVTYETIRYERDGPVATLTLNRPDHMNGMTNRMVRETTQALAAAAEDRDVRVLILTGAGRAFSPGADLGNVASGAPDEPLRADDFRAPVFLHEMPAVTIAAINGACAGAGLGWACACDLRIAAESARFNTAFLDVGVAGDMGGPWTLARLVGPAKARELYFLPQKFDAAEAARIGLVAKVVPDAELRGRGRRDRQPPRGRCAPRAAGAQGELRRQRAHGPRRLRRARDRAPPQPVPHPRHP